MSARREQRARPITMEERRLAIRERQLQETEEQFQEVARQWLTKERQLQELAALVQLKEQQLQARDQQLHNKDVQLHDKDMELQLRGQQLQDKEKLVQAKEQLVTTTNQLLSARELQLAEQEAKLQAKDQQVDELNRQVQEIKEHLSVKQQHLDEVLNSRALRIGSTLTWPVRKLRHSRFVSGQASRVQEKNADSIPIQEIAEEIAEVDAAPSISPARNVGTLTIGVVTYNNSQEQLARLSRSVELAARNLEEAQVRLRLFVIDNGRESAWPESTIESRRFETQGNIGFGRGMNVLMAAAFAEEETEWFLCLNPDGVMNHKALRELLSSSRAHPDSLIEARQFPEEHVKPYDPLTLETSWATGACLLLRRRIFESIGGFDPNFFMYLEDIDLSWRARSAGFSIVVSPNALFGHAVIHRKPDPNIDRAFLLSGRYLAFKWKNTEFYKWAERELVKRKHFQSRSELPELVESNHTLNKINPELSNFNHYFNFSPPRW